MIVVSVSPSSQMFSNLQSLHLLFVQRPKRKIHLFMLPFILFFFAFLALREKPLIKTFLVCGILLVGWARAFHLLTFSNRLLLEICFTDVFCLFRSLRLPIDSSPFLSSLLARLREPFGNRLINIFSLATETCDLHTRLYFLLLFT